MVSTGNTGKVGRGSYVDGKPVGSGRGRRKGIAICIDESRAVTIQYPDGICVCTNITVIPDSEIPEAEKPFVERVRREIGLTT